MLAARHNLAGVLVWLQLVVAGLLLTARDRGADAGREAQAPAGRLPRASHAQAVRGRGPGRTMSGLAGRGRELLARRRGGLS